MLEKLHTLQDNKICRTAAKYIFYLAVIIECLIVIIDKSHYMNPIEGRLFQITFMLCTLKVVLTKYSYREYIAIFIACALGVMVDMLGDRNEILRIFMFVAACRDIDIKKCLKVMLWITTAGCAILAILSITGIFGELTVLKEYSGSIFIERYCFGMGNANSFHIMFFALTLLAMYVYSDTMKWWGYGIIFVANIGLAFLTACKTGTAMTALAVVGMYLVNAYMKAIENRKEDVRQTVKKEESRTVCGGLLIKIAGAALIAIQPVLIAFSVVFAHITKYLYYYRWSDYDELDKVRKGYRPDGWLKLDQLLTGRIGYLNSDTAWNGSLKTWHLLPVKENTAYFDLGLVRVFYWYGILMASLIFILVLLLMVFVYRRQRYTELMFIALIMMFSFVEAHFVSVYIGRCYPLVILGGLWAQMLSASESVRHE